MDTHSQDWRSMTEALARLGANLKHPTRLVLIGSSVGMFYGQPGRMTEDIDVWTPKSLVDIADLMQACEQAGIVFDPQGYDVPNGMPYLQMIKPGIVHVGKWTSDEHMMQTGNLTVVHPPVANIIASKLVRCSDSDIEDIIYLMERCSLEMADVRNAVQTLGKSVQENALENMVLLEIHAAAMADVHSTLKASASSVGLPAADPAVNERTIGTVQPRRPRP
jgi:F0F1-type ATP synthase epsilon subunit